MSFEELIFAWQPFDDEPAGPNLIDLQSPSAQLQATLQMEEEVDINALQEREHAIRKIETDIVEVNQIFKDLATMVHEQGEVIDSIEANVETASIQVNEGAGQIAKAREYQVCGHITNFALRTSLTYEAFSFR